MAINLGGTADVRRILGASTNELADSEIESFLNEAERKIKARHFRKYMVDSFFSNIIRRNGNVNRSYSTYFPIKSGTDPEVYVNGVLATSTTDYTLTDGVITFTFDYSLYAGDRIVIYYQPDFFDDYANYLASLRMYMVSVIDSNNAVAQSNIDNIKETLKEYETMIARKPHMVFARDHKESPNDIY